MDRVLGFDIPFLIQAGIQVISIVLMCVILAKLLYNPVKNFLHKRTERIRTSLENTANDLKEANKLKESYELKIKEIEKERSAILDNAKQAALTRQKQIIAEATEEAMTIKSRALTDIDREKEKASDEMKKQMIELSTLIAGRFVESNIDEATHKKLLNEAISDLGDVKWLN